MTLRIFRYDDGWAYSVTYKGHTRAGWAETRGRAISARLVAMYELREATT